METLPPSLRWKRFWVPIGGDITCDMSGGFLQDPDSHYGKFSNKELKSLTDLASVRCLILMGEPGIGKSQSLRDFGASLASASLPTQFVDFRNYPDLPTFKEKVIESNYWTNLVSGTSTLRLLIDGLDEGLIKIPGFLDYFVNECRDLSAESIGNLRVILTCRLLDWPSATGQNLINLFPSDKNPEAVVIPNVWEMCPLRQVDVVQAAVANGLNSNDFIQAIYDHHLTALAARPITLQMLLRQFAVQGCFSIGHRELYQSNCLALCEEYDKPRNRRIAGVLGRNYSPQKLLRVSCKIAAFLMLSGKSSVLFEEKETPQSSDLLTTDLYGFDRLNDETFEIDGSLVEAALATPLFWAKGIGRVGFQHQTFAECLAASYLDSLSLTEARMLLCQRTPAEEYVIPQLYEVASWLASNNEAFFSFLLEREPGILLRSDTSNLEGIKKMRLVVAFLQAAERQEQYDFFGQKLFFCSLVDPQLGKTLKPFILNDQLNIVCRRLAVSIAKKCSTKELFLPFLQVLKRKHDPLNYFIYPALENLADKSSAPLLVTFLKKEILRLTTRERNYIIVALLKTVWSLTDALPFLDGKGKTYDSLYFCLPDYLTPNQNKAVLQKLAELQDVLDSIHPFHRLADASCKMALGQLDDAETSTLLIEVLRRSVGRGNKLSGEKDSLFETELKTDPVIRRKLITALVQAEKVENPLLSTIPESFATSEDFAWMLERLRNSKGNDVKSWLAMVGICSGWRGVAWDEFLETVALVPELALRLDWRSSTPLRKRRYLDPIDLAARREKANWLRYRLRRRRRNTPEPRSIWLADDFEALDEGLYQRWVNLTQNLFRQEDGHYRSPFSQYDLTAAPGWSSLTPAQVTKVYDAAYNFLLKWQGCKNEPPNQVSNYGEAGYYALYLLRDKISDDLRLKEAVSSNWIPAILNYWGDDGAQHAAIARLAYSLNGRVCRRFFLAELRATARADSGLTLAPLPFKTSWDRKLQNVLLNFLKRDFYKPATVECLIQDMAEINYSNAMDAWEVIIRRFSKMTRIGDDLVAAATSTLMAEGIARSWDKTFPLLKRRLGLAKKVFLRLAGSRNDFNRLGLRDLSSQRIANFFLLVYKIFPPSKDEPIPEGMHTPTPLMNVARMREAILDSVASSADDAACSQLLRLASSTSPKDAIWIRARYIRALQEQRRKLWVPSEPRVLNHTLNGRTANLIRTEDDLLLIVEDSLTRLQSDLSQKINSTVLNYWLWTEKGNKKTNFRPKSEVDISALIADWLRKDLVKSGALILVEMHVQWNQRTDIAVVASKSFNGTIKHFTLTIEVKKSSNNQVQLACQSQLVDTYLKKSGNKHGIYLIVHLSGAANLKIRNYLKERTIPSMRKEVADMALRCVKADPTLSLKGLLLHVTL